MPTLGHCPICDRPPGEPYYLNGPDRSTVCGWFNFRKQGHGVIHDEAECRAHAFNWRKAYFELHAEHTARIAQLRVAQAALTRHHETQAKKAEPFRDGARIE